MMQDTTEQKESSPWDEIRECLRETSRMMHESEKQRQKERAEYKKLRQKERAEYKKQRQKERAEDKKRQAEYEKQRQKEHAEYEKRHAEYERQQEKAEKQMAELRLQMKETDRKLKEEATRYASLTGHVVEGLMEPSAMALFQQAGFDISKCWKNMRGKRKDLNIGMEVDLFLHDTSDAVAVEVKTNCSKGDVDYFLMQMGKFADVFQQYADTNVFLAMAAINYDHEADKYAAEKGMFVIRVCEDAFSLDPAQKENMTYFYQGECHKGESKSEN